MKWFKTVNHLFRPRTSNNHRAKVLHPDMLGVFAALMVLVFLGVSFLPRIFDPHGLVLGFASNITPLDVLTQTNQQRAAAGLSALSFNTQLSQAATAKGQDMMAKQYWAHTAPDGTQPWFFIKNTGYNYTVAGENLARDFSETGDMMNAWMESPTHRANIINTQYQDLGIAVINGSLDGTETTLVVQMFGFPKAASAVAPVSDTVNSVSLIETVPQTVETSVAVTTVPVAETSPILVTAPETADVATSEAQVLAGFTLPPGNLSTPPLFQPLQILKASFLAVIMMISFALFYDSVVVDNRQVIRLVGHNLGHVLLFATVAYLLLSFKAGILG